MEQKKEEPKPIRKTIGKMTYEVSLYFNENSKEGVYDKLKRIIVNDSDNCGKNPD